MKTAISIPDDLFVSAERVSKELGISRSRLFARALEEYLAKYSRDNIVEALDEIYQDEESTIDQDIVKVQREVIQENDTSW